MMTKHCTYASLRYKNISISIITVLEFTCWMVCCTIAEILITETASAIHHCSTVTMPVRQHHHGQQSRKKATITTLAIAGLLMETSY
ncbi:hypothetical protein DICVIV_13911 [Dictyocaulus viviparus]|uniref:Uncharacterized protein n=1 Tax=Dictyocaulus viviparus TaxID=29172 RepID=A0A0D8X950_DICVI|nr:hypothetical protein DICVIV_13911 [Dictyocaulus viviparus]